MIGFSMYGFVAGMPLFVLAMVVITVGEMIAMPTSNSLAAPFAPEEMRVCYMAVFGFTWAVPSLVGPWTAGLILDNYIPNFVWYIAGLLSLVAVAAFYFLHARLGAGEKFRLGERGQAAASPTS